MFRKHRFMILLVLILSIFMFTGCAALKKANSEINPADVQAQAQQIQTTAAPFVPLPLQPFMPLISGALGYAACLLRQLYKDHMAEVNALKKPQT